MAMNVVLVDLESDRLDYKITLPDTESLARLMAAMANGKGGKIVVGYREATHEVVGVTPDQRVEEHIANIVAEVISPRIGYAVSYGSMADKIILNIEVQAGTSKPYFLKKWGMGEGVFIRIGSTTRRADKDDIARLIREGNNVSFDSERTECAATEVSQELVQAYLKKRAVRLVPLQFNSCRF